MANELGVQAASDLRKGLGLAPLTLGNVLSGNIVKNKKDPERIKAAEDALNKALAGDQAAYEYMIGQSKNSATDVGKKAFQQALKLLQDNGGVGGGSRTQTPQSISLPSPSSSSNPITDTINSITGLIGNSPIGDAARQLNGGKAITLENLLGGATKNITDGLGGIANKIGDLATSNAGLTALGVAQGVNAANLQKQSNQYAKDALGSVRQSYNERAPLRAQGLQGLTNPQSMALPELSSIRGELNSKPSLSNLPQTQGASSLDAARNSLGSLKPMALPQTVGSLPSPVSTAPRPMNLPDTADLSKVKAIAGNLKPMALPRDKGNPYAKKPQPIGLAGVA